MVGYDGNGMGWTDRYGRWVPSDHERATMGSINDEKKEPSPEPPKDDLPEPVVAEDGILRRFWQWIAG